MAAAQRGLADRIDVVGGDFFKAVPPADLYVLKMILHDWDDDRCVQILEERSLAEYDALLSAAGLQRTAVVPTRSAQSVVGAA